VVPFGVVAIAFVAFSLPPYLTFDPAQSRVAGPYPIPFYYPLLVLHVVSGSVAILTCGLQVWPWFRNRYPAVHRWTGRAYVFAGVLPAGLAAFVIGATSTFGPIARASSLILAPLWLGCTIAGYRAARQRRFVDHRRWMIRSFVLTASTVTNRVWGVVGFVVVAPEVAATFGGDEKLMSYMIAGMTTWLGWTIPLLLSQWWLDRRPKLSGSA
jgi:hypothetical protein